MTDITELRRLIKERIDNEGYVMAGDATFWDNEVNYLSQNAAETINLLENECSPEDIYWISEVFDEISAKLQSKDYLDALHRIYNKMPKEIQDSIQVDIKFAVNAYDGDYDSPFVDKKEDAPKE